MLMTLGRGLMPARPKKSPPASADPSLQGVVPSCVFDLDATMADSYPGSGTTWHNLCTAPADGAAQSAYNVTRGAASGSASFMPSFVGTAGSAGAYFALDGTQCFSLLANTPFLNSLHRTNTSVPQAGFIAFRYIESAVTQHIIATNFSTTTIGSRLVLPPGNKINLHQRGDSGNASSISAGALSNGQDCIVGWSCTSDGSAVRFWVNSTYCETISRTPNASTTTTANSPLRIGTSGNTTSGAALASGTRIYAVSMFNGYLNNTQATKIMAAYKDRHGRSYI